MKAQNTAEIKEKTKTEIFGSPVVKIRREIVV